MGKLPIERWAQFPLFSWVPILLGGCLTETWDLHLDPQTTTKKGGPKILRGSLRGQEQLGKLLGLYYK